MTIVNEKAYAKLNLCLTVGERLENGYHLVESLMQSISLHDPVRLEKSDKISVSCGDSRLPEDSRNLAYKAAALFFEKSGVRGGVNISLTKCIPICAGLGGGSADGAAVLRGLNRLYGTPFKYSELEAMAASLGADVPFCIRGGTVFVTGVGDSIEVLPHLPLYYVLIFDKTSLSTPKMYAALDAGIKSPSDAAECRRAHLAGDTQGVINKIGNSFLNVAMEACPRIESNINALLGQGALCANISGKGPTVFGVFTDKEKALQCAATVRGTFAQSVKMY